MAYGFFSIVGMFVGSAWDITQNHGYWIGVVSRTAVHTLRTLGLA
jgi:hypothetical protein